MKTVLITGGNRGLGAALVQTFAAAGWRVLATARRPESLPAVTSAAFSLDLASHESVLKLVEDLKQVERIDCIIHNAGFNPKDKKDSPGYFESTFYCKDFSAANVAESMMINALHPMELTGKLLPQLNEKGGSVIAISSWLGSIGGRTAPAGHYGYCGSKALMNAFIKGLALEFSAAAKKNESQRAAVAVNPGWMKTDMGGSNAELLPEEVAQRILSMVEENGFLVSQNGKFLDTDRKVHEW